MSDIRSRYENFNNEGIHEGESPTKKAQKFFDMLASANNPIYDGAIESALSRLLGARTN